MFYDEKDYCQTLKWDDIFTSGSQFATKMIDVGGITSPTDLAELYTIMSFKYSRSFTRYTDEFAFIMAIKRELYTEFPFYLKKKELANEMMEIEIATIQIGMRQLRNVVDQHDEPITGASTTPIDDLSTTQESIRITNNELDAIKQKYNVMNRNFLKGIYSQCDELFRVILSEDTQILFEQES